MSDAPPNLHMLNIVVRDMAASLEFYRRLGVPAPHGEDPSGAHVQLRMPSGSNLALDTAESARHWHAGWRTDPASVDVVIGFALPSRQAVDERYDELTAAGYVGRQLPFDAFWAPATRSWLIRRERRRAHGPDRCVAPEVAAGGVPSP